MTRQFGVAHTYLAVRLSDVFVWLTAIGEAPYLNTRVTLEQLPWKIFPPRFGLFFELPEIGLPATRPFAVSTLAVYPGDRGELTVIDANGPHIVKIESGSPFRADKEAVNAEKAFLAYKQIGVANCMIAPVDAMVPMIFARAFGPDTYAKCEDWIAKNCGKA